MYKLPIFKLNEVKHFKFTKLQIIDLEIEYTRYILDKELITNIEQLLNISVEQSPTSSKTRKQYENKNIIERFTIECINHGITYTNTDTDTDTYTIEKIELLKLQFLFNTILNNIEELQNTPYFKKMINEFYEKRLLFQNKYRNMNSNANTNTILAIAKLFMDTNKKFINTIAELQASNDITIIPPIHPICNISLISDDIYIIRYRDYTKEINFSRYYKLIKNYDRPFPYDFIKMILRYSIFDTSTQQWSIGVNLYDSVSNLFDVNFEMFASPLNFSLNMFCSIFSDTDKLFGSIGNFYNVYRNITNTTNKLQTTNTIQTTSITNATNIDLLLNKNITGVIYNPPYIAQLLDTTSKMCIQLLQQMECHNKDFNIIAFLPNWLDADYIQYFINSPYVIEYKTMYKGTYILQEKDKGRLIKGTFDLLVVLLNSNSKSIMNTSKWDDASKKFKSIIKNMKNEIV